MVLWRQDLERGIQEITACIHFSITNMKKVVIMFPNSSSFEYTSLCK